MSAGTTSGSSDEEQPSSPAGDEQPSSTSGEAQTSTTASDPTTSSATDDQTTTDSSSDEQTTSTTADDGATDTTSDDTTPSVDGEEVIATSPFAIGHKGQAVRLIVLTDPDHAQAMAQDSELVVRLKIMPSGPVMIDADGNVVDLPPTIDEARAAAWTAAKAYRDQRQTGTCSTPSGVIQIDDGSKLKINGAVNMAMLAEQLGQAFSVNWTMADNTVVALDDAKAMIQVGLAVGQYISACQDACSAVRDKIDAASTVEDVQAIDVTGGYPG